MEKLHALFEKVKSLIDRAIEAIRKIPEKIRNLRDKGKQVAEQQTQDAKDAVHAIKMDQKKKEAAKSIIVDKDTTVHHREYGTDPKTGKTMYHPNGNAKKGMQCIASVDKETMKITAITRDYQTACNSISQPIELTHELSEISSDIHNHLDDYSKVHNECADHTNDIRTAMWEYSSQCVQVERNLKNYKKQIEDIEKWCKNWVDGNPNKINQTVANQMFSCNANVLAAVSRTTSLMLKCA